MKTYVKVLLGIGAAGLFIAGGNYLWKNVLNGSKKKKDEPLIPDLTKTSISSDNANNNTPSPSPHISISHINKSKYGYKANEVLYAQDDNAAYYNFPAARTANIISNIIKKKNDQAGYFLSDAPDGFIQVKVRNNNGDWKEAYVMAYHVGPETRGEAAPAYSGVDGFNNMTSLMEVQNESFSGVDGFNNFVRTDQSYRQCLQSGNHWDSNGLGCFKPEAHRTNTIFGVDGFNNFVLTDQSYRQCLQSGNHWDSNGLGCFKPEAHRTNTIFGVDGFNNFVLTDQSYRQCLQSGNHWDSNGLGCFKPEVYKPATIFG